ncbi:hypothetical protein FXF50_11795 [Micromonospora sp. AP08]|uniref:hypothetical protein n=1 Tax=Micromonospora sp. AP08 TaxID=2604467 RepID=UPI0011DBC1BD|nr:hypothetical protein [Micromonospora sp. AP08]TYB38316.1 hypothetical protein FXF50_11795 [Micromonospora sp. AP08]
MSRYRLLPWITVAALLGGCGSAGNSPAVDPLDGLRQQAGDALTRYDRAVRAAGGAPFVPVGELTRQLGDWEPANGSYKESLSAGLVEAASTLPVAPQPAGTIVWANGIRQDVPLISADGALAQLRAAGTGDCSGCAPLKLTGARLTTMTVPTTRGLATAPAWEYTLAGTTVRLARVAVDPSAILRVTPPPWDADQPHEGLAIESATTTTASSELTVTFTGATGPNSEPCGADYGAEAAESDLAVVVIVIEYRHAKDEACPAIGAQRSATLKLSRPLGERAVLEVTQGLPVELTITG